MMLQITAHEPEELLLSGEEALKDAEELEKRWQEWERKHQQKPIRIDLPQSEYDVLEDLAKEKRDWLRENYIRTLIDDSVKGEELEEALEALDRVDKRLEEEGNNRQMLAEMELNAQAKFRKWCIERGMNPDEMSEEQAMELIDKVVHEARKRK